MKRYRSNATEVSAHLRRRDFLCRSLGWGGLAATVDSLRMINAATATHKTLAGDFKALVCVFLYGGNDSHNVLIPNDDGYVAYAEARSNLAVPQASILPISPASPGDGRSFGMHANQAGMARLFARGKLAWQLNVGSLLAPTTRAQYLGGVNLPAQLFSHFDQARQWQTSISQAGPRTGWGGRLADALAELNQDSSISMCLSIAGSNTFQVGNAFKPFHLTSDGSIQLQSTDPDVPVTAIRDQAIRDILQLPHANLFGQAYANQMRDAMEDGELIQAQLDQASPLSTMFPDTRLGGELSMVARMIQIRAELGMRRQIYFVALGGFDTHFEQVESHPARLLEIDQAVKAFYDATVEMQVEDEVTTFTASDFGRTYTSNGRGSDHGWGAHHFIVGGAVNGGDFYGVMPQLEVNGPDDSTRGRWIPTVAVDQYAATLARWFGVPEAELPLVAPNIGRFATSDLGFMGLA